MDLVVHPDDCDLTGLHFPVLLSPRLAGVSCEKGTAVLILDDIVICQYIAWDMKRQTDPDVLLLQAAADPTRLAILRELSEEESVCADFTACCDVSQPTVSHHLKVLREAGWVDSERRGTWIWYRLRPKRSPASASLRAASRPVRHVPSPAQTADSASSSRPPDDGPAAAFCFGSGHVVVYGNSAFHASFGPSAIGLPAREILVDLSRPFEVMDQVYDEGRPLATWLPGPDEDWRLTVAPRRDRRPVRPTASPSICAPAQTCRSSDRRPPESFGTRSATVRHD